LHDTFNNANGTKPLMSSLEVSKCSFPTLGIVSCHENMETKDVMYFHLAAERVRRLASLPTYPTVQVTSRFNYMTQFLFSLNSRRHAMGVEPSWSPTQNKIRNYVL